MTITSILFLKKKYLLYANLLFSSLNKAYICNTINIKHLYQLPFFIFIVFFTPLFIISRKKSRRSNSIIIYIYTHTMYIYIYKYIFVSTGNTQ